MNYRERADVDTCGQGMGCMTTSVEEVRFVTICVEGTEAEPEIALEDRGCDGGEE